MNQLRDAYIELLQELYDAEQQTLQSLPLMSQAASHAEVKQAFDEHLQMTQEQIRMLDQVFQRLGQSPGGHHCKIMQAMVQETQQKIQMVRDPDTLDAVLIAAAQKVEHFEITGYGTARTWALHMNEMDAAEILQRIADQEGETDKRLTRLAETRINREAMANPQAAAA